MTDEGRFPVLKTLVPVLRCRWFCSRMLECGYLIMSIRIWWEAIASLNTKSDYTSDQKRDELD